MKTLITFLATILIFSAAQVGLAQTTIFTFQGSLTDQGSPANGSYQMQFKMFDTLAGGNQIGSTVSKADVTVTQGSFTTQLDFGANAFPGADRFLEIAVRRNSNEAYTTLNPRQQIASSPYAIKAINAQQADVALDAQKLGGVAASEYVNNSTVSSSFIKNDTTQQTANFNITGNGVVGGRIGIGTASPNTRLTLGSGVPWTASGWTASMNLQNVSALGWEANASGQRFGIGQTGGGLYFFRTGSQFGTTTSPANYDMLISDSGNIGIGTIAPSPFYRLDVEGHGGVRSISNSASHFVAETTGGTNTWARTYWRSSSRSWFMGTSQNFNGNQLYIADETAGQTRMVISTAGHVGIGTINPSLASGSSGKILEVADSFSPGLAIRNTSTGGNQYFIYSGANNSPGSGHFKIYDATNVVDRFVIGNNGNVGIGTSNPATKLDVAGTTKTNILQITGGSDLAENFEMADAQVKPGMIVAIDPQNSGKLVLARGAYNRQVAGIISGANNLSAGMILPDLKEGENSMPVALSGRVWVYADATKKPIKPGDLLTTSEIPGYAMKVTKYKRAQGAIIGKAMTELKSGTGLVLVLVSLQ